MRFNGMRIAILSGGHRYKKNNGTNLGDVAQLEHILYLGREYLKSDNFVLLAHSLNDTAPFKNINYSSKFIEYLFGESGQRPGPFGVIARSIAVVVAALFPTYSRNFLAKAFKSLDTIREADLVVVSGSGTLSDHYWRGPAYIWTLVMLCAAAQRKPVVLLGQQIGPLESFFSRLFVGLALKKALFVGVRDFRSLDVAKSLGVSPDNVSFTGDEGAYLLPCAPEKTLEALEQYGLRRKSFIAVQFRIDENCPFSENIEDFARTVSLLAQRLACSVAFVPMSYADSGDDREMCATVAAHLSCESVIVDLKGDPSLTKGVLENAAMALGVANHFCVFAVSVGTPTLGLYGTEYMKQKLSGLEHVSEIFKAYAIEKISHDSNFSNDVDVFLEKVKQVDFKGYQKPDLYFEWLNRVQNA